MILHVYTTTWNERYMMPYFLRHYAEVADHVFVVDDGSDDGTREVVEACPKASLVPYPYESGLVEGNKQKLFSRLYRKLSRGTADWVICVDCDEFVYHRDLRGVLESQAATTHIVKPDVGMILGANEVPDTDGQLYDACPLGFSIKAYAKPCIFRAGADVWFGLGQHHVRSRGANVVTGTGIWLLHCCYLSRDWVMDHLERRFARMPQHELARVTARGLTLNHAKKRAMRAFDNLQPWAKP